VKNRDATHIANNGTWMVNARLENVNVHAQNLAARKSVPRKALQDLNVVLESVSANASKHLATNSALKMETLVEAVISGIKNASVNVIQTTVLISAKRTMLAIR